MLQLHSQRRASFQKRLGFTMEGLGNKELHINCAWYDQAMAGLLKPDVDTRINILFWP